LTNTYLFTISYFCISIGEILNLIELICCTRDQKNPMSASDHDFPTNPFSILNLNRIFKDAQIIRKHRRRNYSESDLRDI